MNQEGLQLDPGSKTILCIGAHPDDCEFSCSGTAAAWAASGNKVVFVSVTDGRSGHHIVSGEEIAARRKSEAMAAAARIGAKSIVMDIHDGFLEPTIKNRLKLIEVIRGVKPDIILTNRPNDYHPDHRYTSQLVQDSAYMLMVPHVETESAALPFNPVIFYWADSFSYPCRFRPNVVVATDSVIDKKIEMLGCHESQVYEWLPFILKYPVPVPEDAVEKAAWLKQYYNAWPKAVDPDAYREHLVRRYGDQAGNSVRHAEAFELCEYGTILDSGGLERVFSDAK